MMNSHDVIRSLLFAIVAATIIGATHKTSAAERAPNVVVLLADDLGWNGLNCYGSDLHPTPALNRLAGQGVRFTQAYAACTVCSPTRAAMMTGMYPARLHLTDWIAGQNRPYAKLAIPKWTQQLEHRHTTLAEALKAGGYKTAHLGKWHLGDKPFYPEHQGFDVNIGGTHAGSPSGGYFLPNRMQLPGAMKGDYLTDHLTSEALKLMERWRDQPFFIHLAYYTVHTPIQGKPELAKQYAAKAKNNTVHTNPVYAAMVHSLDESVGRITAKLKELKLEENTLLIFASDNGGLSHKLLTGAPKRTGITLNTPLRRGKGSAYEGGTRTPLIIRWPARFAGGRVTDTPACTIDMYPTILAATGVAGSAAHNKAVDGVNLLPLLASEGAALPPRALYWHYPHYHAGGSGPHGVVRDGDLKLIEYFEDNRVELYDLAKDPGEANDLAATQPGVAKRLKQQLHAWRKSIDAQMPTPNPDYDPQRALQGKRRR